MSVFVWVEFIIQIMNLLNLPWIKFFQVLFQVYLMSNELLFLDLNVSLPSMSFSLGFTYHMNCSKKHFWLAIDLPIRLDQSEIEKYWERRKLTFCIVSTSCFCFIRAAIICVKCITDCCYFVNFFFCRSVVCRSMLFLHNLWIYPNLF